MKFTVSNVVLAAVFLFWLVCMVVIVLSPYPCTEVAKVALATEQYDEQAADLFYHCNTTGGKDEVCEKLPLIALRSERNHQVLKEAAASCLGSPSTPSGGTSKDQNSTEGFVVPPGGNLGNPFTEL